MLTRTISISHSSRKQHVQLLYGTCEKLLAKSDAVRVDRNVETHWPSRSPLSGPTHDERANIFRLVYETGTERDQFVSVNRHFFNAFEQAMSEARRDASGAQLKRLLEATELGKLADIRISGRDFRLPWRDLSA